MDQNFAQMGEGSTTGEQKSVNLWSKRDVQRSAEPIDEALRQLPGAGVKDNLLSVWLGGISESDV